MSMIWLAKNDEMLLSQATQARMMATNCLSSPNSAGADLKIGSIIIELSVKHAPLSDGLVLDYQDKTASNCSLTVWMNENGETIVEFRLGMAVNRLAISEYLSDPPEQLRITYSWDTIKKQALLSVEDPENGSLMQAESDNPLPFPLTLINALISQNDATSIAPRVDFLAVSDQIEPVGFIPSIAKGSPIETPFGMVPIEQLKPKDMVMTADHGPQPVRWVCSRTVPMTGLFCPLRLRAPYFGLTRDILIAPEQRIVFENDEVEYLFGEESILAEARHIANQTNVIPEASNAKNIDLYQLLFDQHQIINVAGCKMESLFIGNITDNLEVFNSTLLAELSAHQIPRHIKLARPLLRSYEAMTLKIGAVH